MTRPLDGIALQTYFRRLNLQKDAQGPVDSHWLPLPQADCQIVAQAICLSGIRPKDAMHHEGRKCQGRVRLSVIS